MSRKIVNVDGSIRTGYHMNRLGEVSPGLTRRQFSLHRSIKRNLTPEECVQLCADLSVHFCDALKRWAHDPITVTVNGRAYKLAEHPHKPGKVRVTYW